MLAKVQAPRLKRDYDDRQADCQNALEQAISQLMIEARIKGWLEGETAVALSVLAQSHLQWLLSTGDTEAAVSVKNALKQVSLLANSLITER